MMQLPEGFDSMFRYITVVAQRAEQLITGAKPRGESRHAKPTLMAQDEVDEGRVSWRILTPEELEAQRQAMVEQFRSEVGVERATAADRPVRDVLPTTTMPDDEEVVEAAPRDDRDDELARLQRLLGIRGPAESQQEDQPVEDQELPDVQDGLLDVAEGAAGGDDEAAGDFGADEDGDDDEDEFEDEDEDEDDGDEDGDEDDDEDEDDEERIDLDDDYDSDSDEEDED